MAYSTQNEIANFDFSQSTIIKLAVKERQVDIRCADVMIPTVNSQNEDVEMLGTDTFFLCIPGAERVELKQDGYRIYNLDDTIREEIPDRLIPEDEWKTVFKELEGQAIYSIEKENGCYVICIDTAETEVSYTLTVWGKSDQESWEDQHRLPPYLRK